MRCWNTLLIFQNYYIIFRRKKQLKINFIYKIILVIMNIGSLEKDTRYGQNSNGNYNAWNVNSNGNANNNNLTNTNAVRPSPL